ncbi:MAG TPA: maleylacetoacetate isomerase [Methylocystis sp.]|nr:maleylacetoacetate isomerase [Methylocystis sp.]
MILYDYFRSSAAYRVRIALELKGLKVERRPVHLLRVEHRDPAYLALNPQGLVPALELDDGVVLTQSLAIIFYLEKLQPAPALIPEEPALAAKAWAVALAIACDTHPLNNLRVVNYLREVLRTSDAGLDEWRRHWIFKGGLEAVENMIEPAPFCFGSAPTLADICLIPQLYNARRFETPLGHLPRILAVDAACAELPAFRAAHPSNQSDSE